MAPKTQPVGVTAVPGTSDMRVGYGVRVVDDAAEIDKTAWAALVSTLITSETGGNKAKFATKVGFTPRTIDRWLESQVVVRPQNVTAVARALGRSPVELLVRVGYLSSAEAGPADQGPLDPLSRRWLAVLGDPNVPDETKHRLREQMRLGLEWMDEIEARRREDREEPPQQRQAAG